MTPLRKPGIPTIPPGSPWSPHLTAIKEHLEILNGQRGGKIATLSTTATLSDVISKINEIITRLNA